MRGEYCCMRRRGWAPRELPPRARRIHTPSCLGGGTCGTTSACAENTIAGRNRPRRRGNYLRVRGEYSSSPITPVTRSELPPRARRIHISAIRGGHVSGTTSACAENTGQWSQPGSYRRNYLRVRGEYRSAMATATESLGTTSACAENTRWYRGVVGEGANYLRVRGEYPK